MKPFEKEIGSRPLMLCLAAAATRLPRFLGRLLSFLLRLLSRRGPMGYDGLSPRSRPLHFMPLQIQSEGSPFFGCGLSAYPPAVK
jgi:hypothetical protein